MSKEKDYLNKLSLLLGEVETINEDIKKVMDDAKDELGKDTATKLKKLAQLLQKDKVNEFIEDASEIDSLYKKLIG